MDLVEEFEREYRQDEENIRWQEVKEDKKMFSKELPERYLVKLIYGYKNKKYNREY